MSRTVYLQTDIGSDIDDAWALAMILKSPELNLKMVLTDTNNTVYRAALVCKILQKAGREDVEVGAGIVQWPDYSSINQRGYVEDYSPDSYPRFTRDGIDRFIEMIRAEKEPVALVAIGPTPSLAAALRKAPDIARKIDLYGMFGSVYKGYDGKTEISAECNVVVDIPASKTVFSANWHSMTITPLDTCGDVHLEGSRYAALVASDEPLMREVIKMYEEWFAFVNKTEDKPMKSSTLFDTVAVHLAMSKDFYRLKRLNIIVDDKGFTRIDTNGTPVDVAIEWTDLEGYCDYLVERMKATVVR